MSVCSIAGCTGKLSAKGLCKSHYERLRVGMPVEAPMRRSLKGVPLVERFALQSTPSADGCITWTGSVNERGYGKIKVDGRTRIAHRVAYETFVGSIPDGLDLDHLCRNHSCVNPDHLEPVTHRENCLRGISPQATNARKTRCPQGHPYDDKNTFVNSKGSRECRACLRERSRATRRAKALAS